MTQEDPGYFFCASRGVITEDCRHLTLEEMHSCPMCQRELLNEEIGLAEYVDWVYSYFIVDFEALTLTPKPRRVAPSTKTRRVASSASVIGPVLSMSRSSGRLHRH